MTDAAAGNDNDERTVGTDGSSQISVIKESCERKFSSLQSKIIERKDHVIVMMRESHNPNQSSYEQGHSKQPMTGLEMVLNHAQRVNSHIQKLFSVIKMLVRSFYESS